jgi:hypothetical protein
MAAIMIWADLLEDGKRVTISEIFFTLMVCEVARLTQILSRTVTYTIDGSTSGDLNPDDLTSDLTNAGPLKS